MWNRRRPLRGKCRWERGNKLQESQQGNADYAVLESGLGFGDCMKRAPLEVLFSSFYQSNSQTSQEVWGVALSVQTLPNL